MLVALYDFLSIFFPFHFTLLHYIFITIDITLMDTSYYPNQLFTPINMSTLCGHEEIGYENCSPIQTNGLVFSHIQQTLQVQTDLKNQQRVQNFLLKSATTEDDSISGFDELYSSVTTDSDLSYLQLMQQSDCPFYTPLEPFADASLLNNCTNDSFDISALPSVAGLDTEYSFTSPENVQYGLYHPLSSIPDVAIDTNGAGSMACDYYFGNNDILAGIDCNAFNDPKSYCDDVDVSSFPRPAISYPSLPQMSYSSSTDNTDMSTWKNPAPLLSASYSFSSFSSASSSEEDLTEELLKNSRTASKRGPKKSASISFFPEKRRKSVIQNQKSNASIPQRKFSQKRGSITSELSYYLSKQKLSDNEDLEEEFAEDSTYNSLRTEMSSSVSTGMICKKGRNVDKACNHCKRSHLRCDNVRPCRRCVTTGKTGCQDVKHKPRGRPRLQKNL